MRRLRLRPFSNLLYRGFPGVLVPYELCPNRFKPRTLEDEVPGLFSCSAGARGGVDLTNVVEQLALWSSFRPCPGVGAQGVSVPVASSRIEPGLEAGSLARGFRPRSYPFFCGYSARPADLP